MVDYEDLKMEVVFNHDNEDIVSDEIAKLRLCVSIGSVEGDAQIKAIRCTTKGIQSVLAR